MANTGSIAAMKAEIDANIVPNNNAQLITGAKVNTTMKDMVDTLYAEVVQVDERIGQDVVFVDKVEQVSKGTQSFGSVLTMENLEIPTGKKIRIKIEGSAIRNTTRLYINAAGGVQLPLPSYTDDCDFEYTSEMDISSLYLCAAITSSGTMKLSISYINEDSGLIKRINESEAEIDEIQLKLTNLENVIGQEIDVTENYTDVSCATSPNYNKVIHSYHTKGKNSKLKIDVSNLVGEYASIRAQWGSTYGLLQELSDSHYYREISLEGFPAGTPVDIVVYTNTQTTIGSCDLSIQETSSAETGTILSRIRKRIDVLTTDTQIEIYEKMKSANDVGNCDVHFENGVYLFDETLYDYMHDNLAINIGFELPIGGGCRYYFHGATLVGEYNGDNQYIHENCNVIGCRNTEGNFELYDGIVVANDITYCVHDDVQNRGLSHVHKHVNMQYIYNGGEFAANHAMCKCIGGGSGLNTTIVIDNCILEKTTENSNKDCVTYHGLADAPSSESRMRVFITNTYMTGGCGVYHLSASAEQEIMEFFITGCVTTSIVHDVEKFYSWNNVTN